MAMRVVGEPGNQIIKVDQGGVLGGVASYLNNSYVAIKGSPTLFNWLDFFDILSPTSNKIAQALVGAGNLLAFAPAAGSVLKMVAIWGDSKIKHTCERVSKLANEAFKFAGKALEFTLGLGKAGVIGLDKATSKGLSYAKSIVALIADGFEAVAVGKALKELKGLKETLPQAVYKRELFLRITNTVKVVAAIFFHSVGFGALFLPFKMGPAFLITGTAFAAATFVGFIADSLLKDAKAASYDGSRVLPVTA